MAVLGEELKRSGLQLPEYTSRAWQETANRQDARVGVAC